MKFSVTEYCLLICFSLFVFFIYPFQSEIIHAQGVDTHSESKNKIIPNHNETLLPDPPPLNEVKQFLDLKRMNAKANKGKNSIEDFLQEKGLIVKMPQNDNQQGAYQQNLIELKGLEKRVHFLETVIFFLALSTIGSSIILLRRR